MKHVFFMSLLADDQQTRDDQNDPLSFSTEEHYS